MANRTVYLFLKSTIKNILSPILVASTLSNVAFAEDPSNDRVEVLKSNIDRNEVKFDRIDSENVELSLPSVGIIAIEDFEASIIYNLRAAYHLNSRLFFEVSFGKAEGDLTTYEELSPGTTLITTDERQYSTADISLGLNLFPGETWLLGRAFSSDLYTIFGAGVTEFGDRRWSTVNVGVGYRLFITDWFATRIDVRDHIFKRNLFGEDSLTHNIELSTSLSFFF